MVTVIYVLKVRHKGHKCEVTVMHVMSLFVSHKYNLFKETIYFVSFLLTSYFFHTPFPWLLFFFCFMSLLSPFHLPCTLYSSSHDCHLKAVIILENMEVYIVQ